MHSMLNINDEALWNNIKVEALWNNIIDGEL